MTSKDGVGLVIPSRRGGSLFFNKGLAMRGCEAIKRALLSTPLAEILDTPLIWIQLSCVWIRLGMHTNNYIKIVPENTIMEIGLIKVTSAIALNKHI